MTRTGGGSTQSPQPFSGSTHHWATARSRVPEGRAPASRTAPQSSAGAPPPQTRRAAACTRQVRPPSPAPPPPAHVSVSAFLRAALAHMQQHRAGLQQRNSVLEPQMLSPVGVFAPNDNALVSKLVTCNASLIGRLLTPPSHTLCCVWGGGGGGLGRLLPEQTRLTSGPPTDPRVACL